MVTCEATRKCWLSNESTFELYFLEQTQTKNENMSVPLPLSATVAWYYDTSETRECITFQKLLLLLHGPFVDTSIQFLLLVIAYLGELP